MADCLKWLMRERSCIIRSLRPRPLIGHHSEVRFLPRAQAQMGRALLVSDTKGLVLMRFIVGAIPTLPRLPFGTGRAAYPHDVSVSQALSRDRIGARLGLQFRGSVEQGFTS